MEIGFIAYFLNQASSYLPFELKPADPLSTRPLP
jgi:hypothetical protein